MNSYSLWVEGYAATGEHGTATYLGCWSGETFGDAVKAWGYWSGETFGHAVKAWNAAENPGGKKWGTLKYNEEHDIWTVWGCRIFDNEADARRAFG